MDRLFITTFLAVSLTVVSAAAQDDSIPFHETFAEAVRSNPEKRPIVVQFGANWCGWCRKMEADTFTDARVVKLAKKYVWVKVDIDAEKEVAARFGVQGVPHTFVLNAEGWVLGSRGGYVSAEKFVEFLSEAEKNPNPIVLLPDLLKRYVAAKSAEEIREATSRLVEQLARPDRVGREVVLEVMESKGASSWPVLVELLGDERLATRAAAGGALKQLSRAGLPFEPFATSDLRRKQIARWRAWLDDPRRETRTE